ncbi:transposase [Candidatus Aalborgicola defluviihabitans]|uniref:transposase n=1 Tax=Candidatus Aalborgicola defluviihabitans TaxID=3386187 RepID=UPI001E058402|nr:transposase [Burkholderiales bacterium]
MVCQDAVGWSSTNAGVPQPLHTPQAIGNERIKALTHSEVVFTVRADDQGGKRTEHLPGCEFIRRSCHVLPTVSSGFATTEFWPVHARRTSSLARLALQMPAPTRWPRVGTGVHGEGGRIETMQCPCCKAGTLRWWQRCQGTRADTG